MAEVSRPLRSHNHLCGDQTLELNTFQPIIVLMNSFYTTSSVLKGFYCVFSMDHKNISFLICYVMEIFANFCSLNGNHLN